MGILLTFFQFIAALPGIEQKLVAVVPGTLATNSSMVFQWGASINNINGLLIAADDAACGDGFFSVNGFDKRTFYTSHIFVLLLFLS